MKLKIIFILIAVLTLVFGFCVHAYFEKPTIYFKDDPSAEVNTDHNVLEYIDKVYKGRILSDDEKLDTSVLGYKEVVIKVKNNYNKTLFYSYKVLVKDTIKPIIEYKKELSVYEGESIDLLDGVRVSDNSNENIVPTISGEYNFNKAGKYNLKYIAEDSSHNRAEEDFTLMVKKREVAATPNVTSRKAVTGYPYYIKLNRSQNVVMVYGLSNGEYSNLVKVFTVSTGAQTPLGVYRTSDKYVWHMLVGNVWGQYSTRITGHILFHSVPYLKQTKDSLEYWEYNLLGTKRSLGCVRLTVEDAKWLYDNCPSGTSVEIYDGDLGGIVKPTIQKIDVNSPNRGWDPTDPDPSNPWKAS